MCNSILLYFCQVKCSKKTFCQLQYSTKMVCQVQCLAKYVCQVQCFNKVVCQGQCDLSFLSFERYIRDILLSAKINGFKNVSAKFNTYKNVSAKFNGFCLPSEMDKILPSEMIQILPSEVFPYEMRKMNSADDTRAPDALIARVYMRVCIHECKHE